MKANKEYKRVDIVHYYEINWIWVAIIVFIIMMWLSEIVK
jgi:hypothetical protein